MMNRPAHITDHAVISYQQRVKQVTYAEAITAIDTPALQAAMKFGANHVVLPTGQRLVIHQGVVITVNPKPVRKRCKRGKPE